MGFDLLDKSIDQLLDDIITDLKNQDPALDTAKGSLEYIRAAALAGVEWGIIQAARYILRQIHADTADEAGLEHHAADYGLTRDTGETMAELLTRLDIRRQKPPAGGNANDYEVWAGEITNVKAAYCYPMVYGLNTVGVLIVADSTATGDEVPSDHTDIAGTNTSVTADKLIDTAATFVTGDVAPGDVVRNITASTSAIVTAVDSETQLSLDADKFTSEGDSYAVDSLVTQVADYIEDVQPIIKDGGLAVFGPAINERDVTMTVTGDEVNKAQIESDIEAYMSTLKPEQTLYLAQLTAIAISNGADNVNITVPAADVVPASREMIRPGVISVA